MTQQKTRLGGWYFLAAVFGVYVLLAVANVTLATEVALHLVQLLMRILPILAVVFALMFLLNVFLKPRAVVRFFGARGVRGWLVAIVGGVLSMGAVYMWYPLMRELRQEGVREAFIATFLYNRAVKVQLLPFLVYYFGLEFTVTATFYMIMFSVVGGLLVEKVVSKPHYFRHAP